MTMMKIAKMGVVLLYKLMVLYCILRAVSASYLRYITIIPIYIPEHRIKLEVRFSTNNSAENKMIAIAHHKCQLL